MSTKQPIDQSMDDLENKVRGLTDSVAAMKTYLLNLGPLIVAAKNAPDRIQAIGDNIQKDIDDIMGAITENTPQATA